MPSKKIGKKLGILLLAASTIIPTSMCSASGDKVSVKLVREEETDAASVKVYKPPINQMNIEFGSLEIDDKGKIFCSFKNSKKDTIGVVSINDEQEASVKTRRIDIKKAIKKLNSKKGAVNVYACESRLQNIYVGCYTYFDKYKSVAIDKSGNISNKKIFDIFDLKVYANKGKSKKERQDEIEYVYRSTKGDKLILIVEEYDRKENQYAISKQIYSFNTGKRVSSKVIYKGPYSYSRITNYQYEKEKYYYTFDDNQVSGLGIANISKYSVKTGECIWKTNKVDILKDLDYCNDKGRLNYSHCILNGQIYLLNGNSIYTFDDSVDDTEPRLVATIPEFDFEDRGINMVGVDDQLVLQCSGADDGTYTSYFVSVKLK